MSKKKKGYKEGPGEPLPPGYTPPKPYANICPRCRAVHGRNVYTFRGSVFGYFCEPCEKVPPWLP